MMGWLGALLRRARLRGLSNGRVQTVRAEATEHDAKDDVERWQDYGFACHPVDGQGLVINAGGHTVVLRMDRLGERPGLAPYDVAVWHKDGHHVKLKAGRVVEVDCAELRITASTAVLIDSPSTTIVQPNLVVGDLQVYGHKHGGGTLSGGLTAPPVV